MITIVRDAPPGALDVHGAASPIGIRLDAGSGTLIGLVDRTDPTRVTPLTIAVTPVWGGTELLGPVGGLQYADTERQVLDGLRVVGTRSEDDGDAYTYVVTARDGEWELDLRYSFTDRPPHVAFAVTVRRAGDATPVKLRDLVLDFGLALDDPGAWLLNAPGNKIRADLPVDTIADPLRVFGPADMHGGPALVALTDPAAPRTAVVWPLPLTEVSLGEVSADAGGATFTVATNLAGHVGGETGLTWGTTYLDARDASWPAVREQLVGWYRNLGLTEPEARPEWIRSANIFEAHVGFSMFAGGLRYERYATAADLHADLARIQELGFDVIQLMPRHPYPSYNVCDYADITTTYGDEDEIRALVAECHRRGMRVLLDIIIHGVIDQEVMDETLAAVKSGPYAGQLDNGHLDVYADTSEDIGWARHIVEYAPYWHDGSPARHPLADEHPEWFMRDSDGTIIRRYTKAFDIANPVWQEYFLDACVDLTQRLGTDGFRVDAPTYNGFATWADGRGHRPSYGPMASVPLLRDLAARLRATNPDMAVYTEPGGALFRATADMTYNYDEHWLVESLLADTDHPQRDWRMVRTAREVARWLMDRDRAEPAGAGIIHHVDSHDSIWWRLPGEQWRRERFGRETTIALLALFALGMDGGFMMFMGGEEQIEPELRRANELRRRRPELGAGTCEYLLDAASSDDVLVALRRQGEHASLVVINLAATAVSCDLTFDGLPAGGVEDVFNDETLPVPQGSAVRVALAPFQPRVLRLS